MRPKMIEITRNDYIPRIPYNLDAAPIAEMFRLETTVIANEKVVICRCCWIFISNQDPLTARKRRSSQNSNEVGRHGFVMCCQDSLVSRPITRPRRMHCSVHKRVDGKSPCTRIGYQGPVLVDERFWTKFSGHFKRRHWTSLVWLSVTRSAPQGKRLAFLFRSRRVCLLQAENTLGGCGGQTAPHGFTPAPRRLP